MKLTSQFLAKLEALVGEMGSALPAAVTVDCKRFFSGGAAYADGRIFMSLTPVGLAVKLAEPDRDVLLRIGGTALQYFPKAPIKKAYVIVPDNLATNIERLKPWCARSVAYVLTLPRPKKKKPKKHRGRGLNL